MKTEIKFLKIPLSSCAMHLLRELCAAVKSGDSGRVNNVRMMYCFWGAGSHNYGLECFYWEQNLCYEWSEDVCKAFFDNLLLNIRGKEKSWVPADLVFEHINFWIKVVISSI